MAAPGINIVIGSEEILGGRGRGAEKEMAKDESQVAGSERMSFRSRDNPRKEL